MKQYHLLVGAFLSVILLSACESEKSKKNRLCYEYFDSIKEKVAERQKTTNSILEAIKEIPETNDVALMDKSMVKEVQLLLNNKGTVRSKLTPLDPKEVFMIGIEQYKNNETAEKVAENNFDLPVYKKDIGTRIIQSGEEKKKSHGDCYFGSSVNYLERDVNDYLKIKYLVVTDCVFQKEPQFYDLNTFESGILIKKVSILNLITTDVEDSFYLMAESSRVVSGEIMADIWQDLRNNFANRLKYSLFISYSSDGINRFSHL